MMKVSCDKLIIMKEQFLYHKIPIQSHIINYKLHLIGMIKDFIVKYLPHHCSDWHQITNTIKEFLITTLRGLNYHLF